MHPISEKLCEAYSELHRNEQVAFPLGERQRNNLDSIVKTVESSFFGVSRFPTPEKKAVAYLYLLIKNRPVSDGNKRLSVLWFEYFCSEHGITPNLGDYTLDAYAISIERTELTMEGTLQLLDELLF